VRPGHGARGGNYAGVSEFVEATSYVVLPVIPSGARNHSLVLTRGKKERFLAPLGMTLDFFEWRKASG